jgi:hypothetical protein
MPVSGFAEETWVANAPGAVSCQARGHGDRFFGKTYLKKGKHAGKKTRDCAVTTAACGEYGLRGDLAGREEVRVMNDPQNGMHWQPHIEP